MRRSFGTGQGPAALLGLLLLLIAGPAPAQDMSSESFVLRNGTLSGGGAVGLESTAPGTTLGPVGATIGQSSPLGVSQGPTSGITLESGFWPTVVAVPEPAPAWAWLALLAALAWVPGRRATR